MRFLSLSDLNALGGIPLSPGALLFTNFGDQVLPSNLFACYFLARANHWVYDC